MTTEENHLGLQLANRYQLETLVARGTLCSVYRGQDTVLRRAIAVKAVPPDQAEAYRSALRATAMFTHPAVVATYDALEHNGWLFVVQEHVLARPLATYTRQGVPAERAIDLVAQIARALAYAHAHDVTHGDLTASAVLIDRHAIVHINNFGLPPDEAYFTSLAGTFEAQTTPHASDAPAAMQEAELARSDANRMAEAPQALATRIAREHDVRAVGFLLWQLLSAPRPSTLPDEPGEANPHEFRKDVPEALRDIVRRCVVSSHPMRIAEVEALLNEIESVSRDLAKAKPAGSEDTPPALRAARAEVAREAAWSEEQTLETSLEWAGQHGNEQVSFSAPTAPATFAGRDQHPGALHPRTNGPPRLRLPSRPLADAPLPAAAPANAPLWSTPARHMGAEQQRRANVTPARGFSNPLTVFLIGAGLFVLFFLIGFFGPALPR